MIPWLAYHLFHWRPFPRIDYVSSYSEAIHAKVIREMRAGGKR